MNCMLMTGLHLNAAAAKSTRLTCVMTMLEQPVPVKVWVAKGISRCIFHVLVLVSASPRVKHCITLQHNKDCLGSLLN